MTDVGSHGPASTCILGRTGSRCACTELIKGAPCDKEDVHAASPTPHGGQCPHEAEPGAGTHVPPGKPHHALGELCPKKPLLT